MRVVSWNVNRRRDCAGQVAAVLALRPDVVVLQEVLLRAWPALGDCFAAGGLPYAACGWELSPPRDPARTLHSGVGIWSRWPLASAKPAMVPDGRAVACVALECEAGAFEVLGVHIPTAGQPDRMLKIETQEGLQQRLADASVPTIVCGDFNSPKFEGVDGLVTPFVSPRLERAHAAEAGLMGAVTASGFVDLFRACKGYAGEAPSWFWKNRGRSGGFRLDHIFATPSIRVRDCDYLHEWRLKGLSDHSAIYADVEVTGSSASDRETAGR